LNHTCKKFTLSWYQNERWMSSEKNRI